MPKSINLTKRLDKTPKKYNEIKGPCSKDTNASTANIILSVCKVNGISMAAKAFLIF